MKTKNLFKYLFVSLFTIITLTSVAKAGYYSKHQARNTIEQTSYIIDNAYDIVNYYSYYQSNNLSRAVYYNNYAQDMYYSHFYRTAIRYSLLARQYALDVIDGCDDYWEYFYYTYFGWSNRYGYNNSFSYRSGYRDGYYDGYYAGYCARYNHDYRRDPYHNLHSDYYQDNYYNNIVMNQSNSSMGRGESGKINRGGNNNGGVTISRPGYTGEPTNNGGYKNINTNDYFSSKELSLTKDIPSTTVMESNFKEKNPNISFNDKNLSSDSKALETNRNASSKFISRNKVNTNNNITQIQKPQQVITPSNDIKRIDGNNSTINNNQNKTNNRITTKINSNNQDNNRQVIERKENTIQPNNRTNNNNNNNNNNRTINTNRTNNNNNNYRPVERKENTNNNSFRNNNYNNNSNNNNHSVETRENNNSNSFRNNNNNRSNNSNSSNRSNSNRTIERSSNSNNNNSNNSSSSNSSNQRRISR